LGEYLYSLNPIAVCSFLTVSCLLVFACWGLFLNHRERANQAFSLMCMHGLVWILGIGFMLCSGDPELAEKWYRFSYLGVVFISPGVFFFTSSITKQLGHQRKIILAAYLMAALFGLEGVLGEKTITGMWAYSWGFYPRYGPLSVPFLLFFFVLMVGSFRNLVRQLRTVQTGMEKRQIKALILSFSIAYLGALDFLPCFGIDIYPFGFFAIVVYMSLIFWSFYRYQLLNPSPESLAREVLATIADSIIVLDADGFIRMVNPKVRELLGYPEKGLMHRHFNSFVDPRSVDASQALVQDFRLSGRDVHSAVITLRNRDGESIPTSCNLSAIRSWKGKLLGVVLACRDLKEIVRSKEIIQEKEEKLQETQERYSALFNRSLFCIFVHDFDGNFLDANQAALDLTGFTREDLPSLNMASLLDEDQLSEAIARLEETRQGGVRRGLLPWKLKKKDGTYIWVETETSLLYRDGEPYAVQGIAHDVTERVRAEEALRVSEVKYRTLVDAAPESIVAVDVDGRIRSCNPATATLTGYTPEELEGKYIHELMTIDPEEMPRVTEFFQDLVLGREVETFEMENIRKDGTKHWTSVKLGLLKSGKEITGILVISRDLTERKRMEEELQRHHDQLKEIVEERTAELKRANRKLEREIAERIQFEERLRKLNDELDRRVRDRTEDLERANAELKQLDSMKDSFLSSVSHELRTPLTSIRSFSEILLSYDQEDTDTQREFIGIINSESERLTRLINDVLDLSRIEAGEMAWNDSLLSVEEVIRSILPAQRKLMDGKSLQLSVDLPEELPPVFADRDRIQQVITNLMANAIKFSRERGEVRIRVETFAGRRSDEPAAWIKVSVSDQGIGIDEKDFDVIFDKFRQVSEDTLKDKPQGTGLGLPICKDIILHYGGNIWVESEIDKGSTFCFTLPAMATDVESRSGDRPAGDPAASNGSGRRILILEENPNTRKVLRSQLEDKGFSVRESASGEEAVALAGKERIDLILLDLLMPMSVGNDLLSLLKEQPATQPIPVLMISVVEDPGRGVLPGAQGFLKKPFREEELIHKVQTLLEDRDRSILVVDDNPGIRHTLQMHLEAMGYPVFLAENGDEALEVLKTSVPDLVILDIIMPHRNGSEVLAWMRNNGDTRDLPVIVLSGYPLFGDLDTLRANGIDACIEKSEDLSPVFSRIDSILQSPAR
jgi:PAS domain S-box-containing protein